MPIHDTAKEPTPRMGEQLPGIGGEKSMKPDTEVSDGIMGTKSNKALSIASND